MKEFFKVNAALILFILGFFGFLTFARNFNKRPSVVLTSTQCSIPCWYGIEPGRSTTSQVYAVLDNFEDVNKDTILGEYNHHEKLIKIYWFFQRPAEDQMGSVNINNDMATAINISTVNSLKLVELIEKAGEPEKYWLGTGYRDDGGPLPISCFSLPQKDMLRNWYSILKLVQITWKSSPARLSSGSPFSLQICTRNSWRPAF
jgi:hypothetical protein